MPTVLFPTTVVGSYPQPDWLVNREVLKSIRVPRIHAPEIWRPEAQFLEAAQDDATILAIRDMEAAGIDIISDGEIRRESYSNRFALMLEGVDADNPAEIVGRTGTVGKVPRIVGPIRRTTPVEVRDAAFLRANTRSKTKITLPGPFTMAQQCKSDFYSDNEEMALAFADAVNAELRDIKTTGVDFVQLDEPWLQARPEEARRYGVRAINRALEGVPGVRIVHLCFGYAHAVSSKEFRLLVPAGARGLCRRPNLDRGGTAEARSRHPPRAVGQDHPSWRSRPWIEGRRVGRRGSRTH